MSEVNNTLQQNTIIFRMGEETGIVIEKTKEQFEHSLFREQYKQALSLVNSIISGSKDADKDAPMSNIVAFCGDRGEGKTSAMMTIRNILVGGDSFEAAKDFFPSDNKIEKNSFKVLRLVDPAFFDSKHNLLELLIGQMYADIRKDDDGTSDKNEDCDCGMNINVAHRNKLMQLFHNVHRSLGVINKASDKSAYDNLEEVDDLAAGIELKEDLNKLIRCYAKYFGKDRVLISIDDLDLNVIEGYQMCEEIRKYLASPEVCTIMIAVKVEQLIEIVQSYLRRKISKDIIENSSIKEMAIRYVTKLLPLNNRIQMPHDDLFNKKMLIIKERGKDDRSFSSLQEAVVQLIYRKTRYIFVNGRFVSPIVPKNLRELRMLIAALWNLKDGGKNDENHVKNKTIFKQYFYHTWVKNLESNDKVFIESFVENPDPISINKTIVSYLAAKYVKFLKPADKKTDERANAALINAIINPQNTKQNVSVGDALLLINTIEDLTEDIDTKNLLFFIKAFYSITLYEAYDVATLDKQHLYALIDESQVSIYKYDRQYRKINALQRVLNGAYFSYSPEDVMTKESQTLTARDIRYINPQPLKKIYEELISKPKEEIQDYEQKLNTLEFFALTTTYDAYNGEEQRENYRRSLTDPLYLRPLRPKASLLTFDVLSIFYNIINIKYTYERWNDFYKVDDVDEQSGNLLADQKNEEEQEAEEKNIQKKQSLFDIASNTDESLYKKMMNECCEGSEDDEIQYAPEHYLISDAAIRFIDVQLAIMDLAMNNKRVHRVKSNKLNIRMLYDDIQALDIALYPIREGENRYPLKFRFLDSICKYLRKIKEDEFNMIFSPAIFNEETNQDLQNLQYALMFIASTLKFPIIGLDMREQIKNTFKEFYRECGGATYWNKLIDKNKTYNNLGELSTRLLVDKVLRETFMQNMDKLIPKYKTTPLF